jgi:hypothetical protein
MDPDEYRHADLVLKAWPKTHIDGLKKHAIYNYKYRTFKLTVPVVATPHGSAPDLHDYNLLHGFGFDLLPEIEITNGNTLLALILYLVCQSNNLFPRAC